jgi:hypothetical protein
MATIAAGVLAIVWEFGWPGAAACVALAIVLLGAKVIASR